MRKHILASVALAALIAGPAYADSADKNATGAAAPNAGVAAGASSTTSGATTSGTAGSTAATSGMKSDDAKAGAAMKTDSGAAPASGAVITAQDRDQLTADTLIGMDVRNPQNDKIGEIEDLVLDSDMKVVGVVVSVGGFLGIGDHNVALQRDQVQITTQGDRNDRIATVSMTKDQLKAAPEFKTIERQQAEADQDRARTTQGTAAGSSATRPMGATPPATTPPARTQ